METSLQLFYLGKGLMYSRSDVWMKKYQDYKI